MTRFSADYPTYAQALLWASAEVAVALLAKGARHQAFLLTLITGLAAISLLVRVALYRGPSACRPHLPAGS
jgi:hypothetical protein